MRAPSTLTRKLLTMGVGFLVVALLSISLTLWVTWKLEGGAAAVNEAGRLRMAMLRMVVAQQTESVQALELRMQQFDASLELLRTGDPSRPLFVPWSDATRAYFEDIRSEWARVREGWRAGVGLTGMAAQADGFVVRVDGLVDAIEVQLAGWTSALRTFQLMMMGLAIAAAVTFMALSYLLVLSPVARLQEGQARLRQGELDVRLPVESDDEFGQLSEGFNRMAQALQASHEGLEQKVREKTASIEVHNQRLQVLYEVSTLASHATTLTTVAQRFVEQVRRAAHADAAVVRWSDESNERYVLLAADGLPQAMADSEQCLPTAACLCGQPQATARTRFIPITALHALALPHCRTAGFQSMVSIPVQMQERVLGEVDLFFRGDAVLGDEVRELLEAMARHLASAMEGLRATALEREAAVAEERSLIARELHDSIAQSLAFLKIQTQLLRDAVARGDAARRDRSINELDAGVRECYSDVRELLVHFRTRTSEEDIESALRVTLSKFEHQTGLPTALHMRGHGLPLAPDVQIQVLHMVQEALSNVRKHAAATRVDVRVDRHPRWRFEVQDDGRGFEASGAPPDSTHVGLGIMRERAQRIGAVVQVQSAPGQGTRVCIELPTQVHDAVPAQGPVTPDAAIAPAALSVG